MLTAVLLSSVLRITLLSKRTHSSFPSQGTASSRGPSSATVLSTGRSRHWVTILYGSPVFEPPFEGGLVGGVGGSVDNKKTEEEKEGG